METINVVPEREAKAVLAQLRYAIDTRLLEPKMGKPQPNIISDFLPKGKRYKRAKTLGHLWEFQYALAVEPKFRVRERGQQVRSLSAYAAHRPCADNVACTIDAADAGEVYHWAKI